MILSARVRIQFASGTRRFYQNSFIVCGHSSTVAVQLSYDLEYEGSILTATVTSRKYKKVLFKMDNCTSAVVEYLSQDPKLKNLNPASSVLYRKKQKSIIVCGQKQ
jgi:hypothetical protein